MSKEQFQSELDYAVAMLLIREMLDSGIINRQDFLQIGKIYTEHYQPIFQI